MKRLFLAMAILLLPILVACTTQTTPPTAPPQAEVIVRQSGGAGALIAECGDRDYIARVSDYIIEGSVEKVEAMWNQDKSQILTYTDLSIEKYLKGAPFPQKKLKIVTPGGTVGEISQWVEDQPIFHEGKRVRSDFETIDGEFAIDCAQFGVENLDSPSAAEKPRT
jgi:hypothetical protein